MSAAFGLYFKHWVFCIAVAAIVMLTGLVAAILNLLPALGQLLFLLIAAVAMLTGAFLTLMKLRGNDPALPMITRVLDMRRVLELVLVGGVAYIVMFAIPPLFILPAMVMLFIGLEHPIFIFIGYLIIIPLAIAVLWITTRLQYGALVIMDVPIGPDGQPVDGGDSMPFTKLSRAWRHGRGNDLRLIGLGLIDSVIFSVCIAVPIIGHLLLGIPIKMAITAAAYRALKGEGYNVPQPKAPVTAEMNLAAAQAAAAQQTETKSAEQTPSA